MGTQSIVFSRIIRFGFLSLVFIMIILFFLTALRLTGEKKRGLQSILTAFSQVHRGVGVWSYYTIRNSIVNVELFQIDPLSNTFLKTPKLDPKIDFHSFLYKGHTEQRFSMLWLAILQHVPESYPWLCRNYPFKKGVRYYVTLGPHSSMGHGRFLFKVPADFKGMARREIPLNPGTLKILSFICN